MAGCMIDWLGGVNQASFLPSPPSPSPPPPPPSSLQPLLLTPLFYLSFFLPFSTSFPLSLSLLLLLCCSPTFSSSLSPPTATGQLCVSP